MLGPTSLKRNHHHVVTDHPVLDEARRVTGDKRLALVWHPESGRWSVSVRRTRTEIMELPVSAFRPQDFGRQHWQTLKRLGSQRHMQALRAEGERLALHWKHKATDCNEKRKERDDYKRFLKHKFEKRGLLWSDPRIDTALNALLGPMQ